MYRIFVHDFKFNYFEIPNNENEQDFYCSVNVYYNFSKNAGDNWDDLEYFNISVANPYGLAKYLQKCIAKNLMPNSFFFPCILITYKNDKNEIMELIKNDLQSLYGKTEKEIILKAIRKYTWENESVNDIYEHLFD